VCRETEMRYVIAVKYSNIVHHIQLNISCGLFTVLLVLQLNVINNYYRLACALRYFVAFVFVLFFWICDMTLSLFNCNGRHSRFGIFSAMERNSWNERNSN